LDRIKKEIVHQAVRIRDSKKELKREQYRILLKRSVCGGNYIMGSLTRKEIYFDTHWKMLHKRLVSQKKSLDDYLLQLRFGKKFGFDF